MLLNIKDKRYLFVIETFILNNHVEYISTKKCNTTELFDGK